tara:strand:+ start:1112 stop:1678 length:567 start_codon:yes stop_codon:yes gene_type:complete
MKNIKLDFLLVVFMMITCEHSYGLYCEVGDFDMRNYDVSSVVEGYVVHQPISYYQLEQGWDKESNINIREFSFKYYGIEEFTSIFVTRVFGKRFQKNMILKVATGYPDRLVGEKYIFFISRDATNGRLVLDPCSVVPLSHEPRYYPDGQSKHIRPLDRHNDYFFRDTPEEIQKQLNDKQKQVEQFGAE